MDGVIIDSEPVHWEIERELLEELGGVFSAEFHNSLLGTTDKYMWQTFKDKFNLSMPLEEIVKLKKERFVKNIHRAPLIKNVDKLISKLYDNGFTLALASSNNRKSVDAVIKNFKLGEHLRFSISGEEVKQGKPEPEIFLTAAKKIGVDPKECLVIEDARNGVLAAKSAGMKCVAYNNPNSGEQDLSDADLIIDSFNELNLDIMKELFL